MAVHSATLLGLLEPGWQRDLAAGVRAAELELEAEVVSAAARALGDAARDRPVTSVAREWPACVVVVLARVAGADGNLWAPWHRAAGLRMTRRSREEWGQAFLDAAGLLGIAAADAREAILVQATASAAAPAAETPLNGDGPTPPRPRLDPFGQGVLVDGRPALPEEVVDPDDPLLAFDSSGERVGPELPAEPVWLLHPADAELAADTPPRVVVTSRLPLTWRGWRLFQADLRQVRWLELTGLDRRHLVRGRSGPVLATGPPVPGVTAGTGAPVFSVPPRVLLPPGPGRCHVEVRRAGTRTVLSGLSTTGDDWRPERLWQRVARPVLGELTVIVTGENTSGLRRTVAVAEGLAVGYFPVPRLTTDRGLEPAEALVITPAGMTVAPQAVPVPADAVTAEVSCVAGQVVQRLRVTPPHIRIRIEPEPGSREAATRWHHQGPLRLGAAQLWHGGALRLDLPGADRDPAIEIVGADGHVAQVLEPTRQGRYPLRRMADTVTARGGATLRITVAGRTATIARITAPTAADPWIDAFS